MRSIRNSILKLVPKVVENQGGLVEISESRRCRGLVWGTLAVAISIPVTAPPAKADEPVFGYTYLTDTQPQGTWEFEQWGTWRTGKSRGDFNLLEYREEVEYGITNEFQIAGYVNGHYVDAFRDNVDGTTGGPFVPGDVDPSGRFSRLEVDSGSIEFLYRLLSPYKDPIGLALYLEPTIGPNISAIENKIIVQKNFLDDQLIWAANLITEPEWEREVEPGEGPIWNSSIEFELSMGLAYRFASNWFAGVQFRNHNEFQGISFSNPEHSAFFLGPNIHYAKQGWWATLTILPQLPLARGYTEENREAIVGGRIFGDEHEKAEVRLRFGIPF